MNKILIIAAIALGSYLVYGTLTDDNEGAERVPEVKVGGNFKPATSADIDPIDETVEIPENGINGKFFLEIVSKEATTHQFLNISKDGHFSWERKKVLPDDGTFAISTGQYSVNKDTLLLTFIENRDLEIFPEDEVTIRLLKDGSLQYGPNKFVNN